MFYILVFPDREKRSFGEDSCSSGDAGFGKDAEAFDASGSYFVHWSREVSCALFLFWKFGVLQGVLVRAALWAPVASQWENTPEPNDI